MIVPYDDRPQLIDLPFPFTFFGNVYQSAWVSPNGFISFGKGSWRWWNSCLPDGSEPNNAIYAFWDDLTPVGGEWGNVYMKQVDADTFVVEWAAVGSYWEWYGRETFEIVLYRDGAIKLQYLDVARVNSCTVGLESLSGYAIPYRCNGVGLPLYDGLAIYYPETREVPITPTPTPNFVTVILQEGLEGYSGTRDSWIDDINQSTNYGSSGSLAIEANRHKKILIRFELPMLDAGAQLISAQLRFNVSTRTNPTPLEVRLYPLRRGWDEATVNWLQAGSGVSWQRPGAGGSLDRREDILARGTLDANANSWIEMDVTSIVQYWMEQPGENYGVLIEGIEQGGVGFVLRSSEHAWQPHRPQLVITYLPPD